TTPESFFADIYFNAQLLPGQAGDSKEKEKRAPNALVPSKIAYFGTHVDFAVDMGSEAFIQYATRLLIIHGNFDKLSLAIYGEVVSAALEDTSPLTTNGVSSLDARPLPPSLDVANHSDPTTLAKQLLETLTDPPPLHLILQLVFCLKPDMDDWDKPNFPYLFFDLTTPVEKLDDLAQIEPARPVDINVSEEVLKTFATAVGEAVGDKVEPAEPLAKILCNASSQNSELVQQLLERIDLEMILTSQKMNGFIVTDLMNATNNVHVAQKLKLSDAFLDLLPEIIESDDPSFDSDARAAAREILQKVQGWTYLQDALSGETVDAAGCGTFLKNVCQEDLSLGIWLSSLLSDPTLLAAILPGENDGPQTPPLLWVEPQQTLTTSDLACFVRAIVAVSSVLAVLSWVDSLGLDDARQHILSIVHLWQGVDSYSQIVNNLLLMRQYTRRLEWFIVDNDPPRKSGYIGEQVLYALAQDPRSVLRPQFMDVIINLEPSLTYIPEHERMSLRKIALVAEDGLPAAVEELTYTSDRPLSLRRLRTIRVSLAIVEDELGKKEGEEALLKALWQESSQGLMDSLVGIFSAAVEDLATQLRTESNLDTPLVENLTHVGHEILSVICRLVPVFPMNAFCLRALVQSIIQTTVITSSMEKKEQKLANTAKKAYDLSIQLITQLSDPTLVVEPHSRAVMVILRTLFTHIPNEEQDPVYHNLQILHLVDHVLPTITTDLTTRASDDELTTWAVEILPTILPELYAFVRGQAPEVKLRLCRTLIEIDVEGVTGIGEWIVLEEFKAVLTLLDALKTSSFDDSYISVALYSLAQAFAFIEGIVDPDRTSFQWFMNRDGQPELSGLLADCLEGMVEGHYDDEHLVRVIKILATSFESLDGRLQFVTALARLHISSSEELTAEIVDLLRRVPKDALVESTLSSELGKFLLRLSKSTDKLSRTKAKTLFELLEWFADSVEATTVLGGLSPSFMGTNLVGLLYDLGEDRIDRLRKKLHVDEDASMESFDLTTLPADLCIPLNALTRLFGSPMVVSSEDFLAPPSTPKAGHRTPEELGVIISPPNALLRSFTSTGLTKTYTSNEFRELRLSPTARQNTSRLPSTHVDVGITASA
ncbi:hypothetical protein DL96DRAFT_1787181, partial [Flagelloscypha sp. PMI_526]